MQLDFSHLVFWHWFALAVILAILDVSLGANFFFVWCGLCATLVGVLKLLMPQMNWEYQFLIFGVCVMASLLIWRQYLKKYRMSSDEPMLNRRAEQYIGRVFTLEVAMINGRGKVRVADSQWIVTGTDDIPAGTMVRVVGVDGTILKVEKA